MVVRRYLPAETGHGCVAITAEQEQTELQNCSGPDKTIKKKNKPLNRSRRLTVDSEKQLCTVRIEFGWVTARRRLTGPARDLGCASRWGDEAPVSKAGGAEPSSAVGC